MREALFICAGEIERPSRPAQLQTLRVFTKTALVSYSLWQTFFGFGFGAGSLVGVGWVSPAGSAFVLLDADDAAGDGVASGTG